MSDEAVEAAYARRPHLDPPSNKLPSLFGDRASISYEPTESGQTRRVFERVEQPKKSWWGGGEGGGSSGGSKSGALQLKKEYEKEQRCLAKENEKTQKKLEEESVEAWRRYYKEQAAFDREERKKQAANEKQLKGKEKEERKQAEASRKKEEKERRDESLRQSFGLRPTESTLVAPSLYSSSQPVAQKQAFFRSFLKPSRRPQLLKPPHTIPAKTASKSTPNASKISPNITSRVVDSQTHSRVFPGMSRAAVYAILSLEEDDAKARAVPGWKDSGWR